MSDGTVPMKLCPRELTAQMAIAAMRTLPVPSSTTAELTVREIWQAAYDAAPAAPPSDSKPRLDMCDLEDEAAHRAVPAAPGDARVSGTAAEYLPLHAIDEKRLLGEALTQTLNGAKSLPEHLRRDYFTGLATIAISIMHGTYGREFTAGFLHDATSSLDDPTQMMFREPRQQ